MDFGVLGSLQVTDDDGEPVDVGGRQPRVLLTALVVAGGGPITADALIEAIWGDEPPRSALGTLQTYVSRLRRSLPERGGPMIELEPGGYRMDLAGHRVDVELFDQLADDGARLLQDDRPAEAREVLEQALALWRGPPLIELVDLRHGIARASSLDERRWSVLEQRISADLQLGRHAEVVAELQTLVDKHPLRERTQEMLALALYRSGRQADALRALSSAAELLRTELGLEPSTELITLESKILTHDPSLAVTPARAASGIERSDRASGTELVGRDAELTELRATLAEAADGARFVVIEGEPGIGKTRLAEELAAAAATGGSTVVWGRSDESGAAPALWPWLPVLRTLVGAVDEPAPALLEDVLHGGAPLLAGQGAALQFERFDAIAEVLERSGARRPLVVVLEDVQWADPVSLALLQFLTTRLRSGVLIVATARTRTVGDTSALTDALGAATRRPGSRRIRLGGLTAAETEALLESVAPAPLSPELAGRIHARADGNPFYAIELARLSAEGADGEVPSSVRDAVRLRLRSVPGATSELLTIAAVMGREVPLGLLARTADLAIGECIERLDPAVAQRLLVPSEEPGSVRFSHALVREVLADELTVLRQASIHLAVADAMAQSSGGDELVPRDQSEVFAEHLSRANPLGDPVRAAAALERAADTAISRVAYTQAEETLGRAARLRREAGSDATAREAELTTLLRLLEVMQATRYYAGTTPDVLDRARDLADSLGLEDVSRKLAWSRWAALSTSCRLAAARPLAERFLRQWGEDERVQVRAAAHVMYGVDEWTRGRIPSAIEHLDRALSHLADAPPPADAFEAEYTVIAQEFVLWSYAARGDRSVDDVLAAFDALLPTVPPHVVSGVCAFAGGVSAVHGRWDDLDRFVHRALDADHASQFAFFGGQLLMQRGLVAAARGCVDDGLSSFLDGRRRYRALGGRTKIVAYQSLVAEHLARHGRFAEAAELCTGARQVDEFDMGWEQIPLLVAEGVVAHATGDERTAAERCSAAVHLADADGCHVLARRAESSAAELGIELTARSVPPPAL